MTSQRLLAKLSISFFWTNKNEYKGDFMNLQKRLDQILKQVEKPGRYIGGEVNSIKKNKETVPEKKITLDKQAEGFKLFKTSFMTWTLL